MQEKMSIEAFAAEQVELDSFVDVIAERPRSERMEDILDAFFGFLNNSEAQA